MTIQKFLDPKKLVRDLAISEHSVVADFGAGLGNYAREILRHIGKTGKIYLIDMNPLVLNRLKNEFNEDGILNVEYINSDLEEKNGSQIKSDFVDVVVVASVLFQALKREEILKEAVRVVRPNGRILVVEWKGCFSGIGPKEEDVFEEEEVLELMKKYSVKLERTLDAGDYHYAFVFRKV